MNDTKEILLADYKTPDFLVEDVFLNIDLGFSKTQVLSVIKFKRNGNHNRALVLQGENLKLLKLNINETNLSDGQSKLTDKDLTIDDVPDEFTLTTLVEIYPDKNFSAEGLYISGEILCTQNEAEGFRKITYYPDRPDIMAPFTTSLTGNKKDFPVMLSNGDIIADKSDGDERTVIWKDPHPKPCYLFALVAGNLEKVTDKYINAKGKTIDLEIYVDPGQTDKCGHALVSLKNAMKWDEDVYGLSYDLSTYMIVAVDSFNMGAMENKGLNIFNSSYVLAKKETATDSDFQGIESVIGHEYFHNWTGNRVTCRDWFQLTLKEGLTVFRDQEFSADMLSRPLKRIQDVKTLREHQFKEDSGPQSHPIRPRSYIEINNFYTATVYEKGAEVIRMIHTLLGKDNFRRGIDLYFKRHDGSAVTTEDFVKCMEDASSKDLSQFQKWYDQKGTPELDIDYILDGEDKLILTLTQKAFLEAGHGSDTEEVQLHFPFNYALIGEKSLLCEETVEIRNKKTVLTFSLRDYGLSKEKMPVVSLNRNFTAPFKVNLEQSENDLIRILQLETDYFSRWQAANKLFFKQVSKIHSCHKESKDWEISEGLIEGLRSILLSNELDDAFKAYIFDLPTESEVNEQFRVYDVEGVHLALKALKLKLAYLFKDEFTSLYTSIDQKNFELSAKAMGERKLKNTCLSYLSLFSSNFDLVFAHYKQASNMTDELSALKSLVMGYKDKAQEVIKDFYQKWNGETLVMQKWLSIQASHPEISISDLRRLEDDRIYDNKVPNLVRSVAGSFANNLVAFNKKDGSGYKYLSNKITEIDRFNPQLAARLAKFLGHRNKLDPSRKEVLTSVLEKLSKQPLSNDTFEIVIKNLKV